MSSSACSGTAASCGRISYHRKDFSGIFTDTLGDEAFHDLSILRLHPQGTGPVRLMLRTLAERVSRGVVFRRRLPKRFRRLPIFVTPDAGLRFWRRNLDVADSQLFDWASEFVHAGDVVWDIGANVGLFSFASAVRAGSSGRVYAVEPDLWLATLLRRSASLTDYSRAPVEILPVAISDKIGLARFRIAARGRCANSLEDAGGSSQAGGVRETGWVATVTLDW